MTQKILETLINKRPTSKVELSIMVNSTRTKIDRHLGDAIGLYDAFQDAMNGNFSTAEKMLDDIKNTKPGRIGFKFDGQKPGTLKEWQFLPSNKATTEEKEQWKKTFDRNMKRIKQLKINRKAYLDRKKAEKEAEQK